MVGMYSRNSPCATGASAAYSRVYKPHYRRENACKCASPWPRC
ncbi:hypothetical protein OOU_Y34scaffold00516g33 [Pyricularia oryzae Y34]|uniref:Uncharacterized protein n=3 Tax=Pyricularia oryzae TaxID=318829 RepID=A0A4P7NC18_PYROR|nr:hypothetical protein OOU_Y34scaffold00516g33 [Pyricularia oryzae Y34]QBZ59502.1 hypothetical protein PoMZ_04463 [Pyricularia oryzae]